MMQKFGQPAADEPDEQAERHEAQADDARTPFDDELELWIIASST
ncbi:MAG: hypothetical protein RMN52_16085 [Anaerolineae bacterium]|nr:hypothetical protein [Candidatus Roseilinea sp.]MDW8451519.1 hypothetical protein [Anaerolineae bacterium]